jgi:hypothetical protein
MGQSFALSLTEGRWPWEMSEFADRRNNDQRGIRYPPRFAVSIELPTSIDVSAVEQYESNVALKGV